LESQRVALQTDAEKQRKALAGERDLALADIDGRKRENDIAIEAARDKAAAEIGEQRAAADASIAKGTEGLRQREARVVAHETAIKERAAALAAALSDR
jgi:hypothetical protein